jgi:uncharacterized protein (TIGR02246 family)
MPIQNPTATDDLAAIRNVLADLAACWNRADAAAYGTLFTDDADYIDVTGTRTQGGTAIGQLHQFLWERFLKGSILDVSSDADVQLITPDVAIVIATGAVRLAGQATASADRQSINTTMLIKRDGVWRIRAFQNSRVQPFQGPPAQPASTVR